MQVIENTAPDAVHFGSRTGDAPDTLDAVWAARDLHGAWFGYEEIPLKHRNGHYQIQARREDFEQGVEEDKIQKRERRGQTQYKIKNDARRAIGNGKELPWPLGMLQSVYEGWHDKRKGSR